MACAGAGTCGFALPNWAAKFFLDALLLETAGVDEKGFPTALADA